jgi:hypothetical protein
MCDFLHDSSFKGLGSHPKLLDLTPGYRIYSPLHHAVVRFDSPLHHAVVGFDSPLHQAVVRFDSPLHHAAERFYSSMDSNQTTPRILNQVLKKLGYESGSVAAGPPWGSARELSLSPLTWWGDPPPPILAPGRVTSPRQFIGV